MCYINGARSATAEDILVIFPWFVFLLEFWFNRSPCSLRFTMFCFLKISLTCTKYELVFKSFQGLSSRPGIFNMVCRIPGPQHGSHSLWRGLNRDRTHCWDEANSSQVSDTSANRMSLFFWGLTSQVSCEAFFTPFHIFSMEFMWDPHDGLSISSTLACSNIHSWTAR